MRTVIMGCGRVGAQVAGLLDREGHDVSVIDTDAEAFRRLPPGYQGDTIIGTGIDEDILRSAGINDAQAFIAVSGKDNRNIMAAQLARLVFDVPDVLCRIADPVREETYRRLGLTTICPTTFVSETILDHMTETAARGYDRNERDDESSSS